MQTKKLLTYTLLTSIMTTALPLSGVLARSDAGKADSSSVSEWAPGISVRSSAGSLASVETSSTQTTASHLKGRFFVKLAQGKRIVLKTSAGTIVASNGEFLVDSQTTAKLHVFRGDAHVEGPVADVALPIEAREWAPVAKEVALDGSDVRKREGDPDEFSRRRTRTKGDEHNKPKNPKVKVSPAVTNTTEPITNVNPEPPPTNPPPNNPPVNPEPPPANPPPVVTGGGFPWLPVVGGVVVAGGITALIVTGNNNDNVVVPASP